MRKMPLVMSGLLLGVGVLGAGVMAGRSSAQMPPDEAGVRRRPIRPPVGRGVDVFTGVSERGQFQEALDQAVANALRSLPGADRMVRYTVREISGEQGGIAGVNRLRVEIEVPNEDRRSPVIPGRPGPLPGGPVFPNPGGPVSDSDSPARALKADLQVKPNRVKLGETATLELTVRNTGDREVRLPFPSGQQFDFEARRGNEVVWRWSADRFFTQALTSLTLRPNQVMTFTGRWDLKNNQGRPVTPGEYQVRGWLPTQLRNVSVSATGTLSVTR